MTSRSAPDRRPGTSLVIGILGGIASGKSAAGALLAGKSGVVIDADAIARAALESAEVRAEAAQAFGQAVLRTDGAIDREALGRIVFGSAAARARLESFTHPRIRAKIRAELEAARARGVPRIVLDVPLLLENDARHGLRAECDVLVFLDSDDRIRDARAVANRGWATGEVARRESVQLPLDQKRAASDHVLVNNGTRADLEAAVAAVLRAIEQRSP
jgi:dephospho-CoA kinase